MPTYFHFLAFKIFAAEQVDVVSLEVGLGGKFDATNVVEYPIVCGVASLGYDHMEILGNTLGQIAGEKTGIFKSGVPAFTVPQPEEAMSVEIRSKNSDSTCEAVCDDAEKGTHSTENSTVFTSLPLAINWLRDSVRKTSLFAVRS
ncbi:hypothetical protein ACS0TY_024476 [Phlomoides rotata]